MTRGFASPSPLLHQAMHNEMTTPPGMPMTGSAPPPQGSTPESMMHYLFMGPNGLRAGWRLLIFSAIAGAPLYGIVLLTRTLGAQQSHQRPQMTPGLAMLDDGVFFFIFWFASWIMTLIEGRTIGDYGLPARKAFRKEFWQGTVIGFVAMSVLLVMLRVSGVFHFGSLALDGAALAKDAVLWGLAFLLVGFAEEFATRGYAQFTLTTGIGFWPAAILLSAGFGALHLGNHGEDPMGALDAGSAGLLFCFILRRTGDLWMPIGVHTAWDWAESFFYGVPDSGQVAPGHMLNPSFHGSKLLTGGSVGPEGSILCFVVLALLWIFFHFWLPQAKYPRPAAQGRKPHHL